ncbi:hypothetical protein D046_2500A, partial [Vibrio parahaemolyticus V-223/04]
MRKDAWRSCWNLASGQDESPRPHLAQSNPAFGWSALNQDPHAGTFPKTDAKAAR